MKEFIITLNSCGKESAPVLEFEDEPISVIGTLLNMISELDPNDVLTVECKRYEFEE